MTDKEGRLLEIGWSSVPERVIKNDPVPVATVAEISGNQVRN